MQPRLRGVLLDLDGTLLDTAPDMAAALNRLRAENGVAPLEPGVIRPHVSHGAAALVRLGFPDVQEEEFQRLRQRFLEVYASDIASATTVFPGFEPVLEALEARQLPWGVVTNKPASLTLPLLAHMRLADRAACVVCGDTVGQRKPHPAPLLHAAGLLGVEPRDCVYVGDAERDVQAGRAAGMHTLVALFGYLGEQDRPEQWQADDLIREPAELLAWLNGTHAAGAAIK
jgi:phosphoglycolate phosphatase